MLQLYRLIYYFTYVFHIKYLNESGYMKPYDTAAIVVIMTFIFNILTINLFLDIFFNYDHITSNSSPFNWIIGLPSAVIAVVIYLYLYKNKKYLTIIESMKKEYTPEQLKFKKWIAICYIGASTFVVVLVAIINGRLN